MIWRVFCAHRTLVSHSFGAEDPTSITKADASGGTASLAMV
jgi:hypothetical protein